MAERCLLAECRELEDDGDTGCIIVGSGINISVANTEVIVMRGDYEVRQLRIGAGTHAEHVGAVALLAPVHRHARVLERVNVGAR